MQQFDDDRPLHYDLGVSVLGRQRTRRWERVRWRIQGLLGLRLSEPRSVLREEREALMEEARQWLEEHRAEIDGQRETTSPGGR